MMASPLVAPHPPPFPASVVGEHSPPAGADDPLTGISAGTLRRATAACAANLPPLPAPTSVTRSVRAGGGGTGGAGGVCRRGRPLAAPAPVPGAAAAPPPTDAHVADAYTFMASLPPPPAPWSRSAPPRALPPPAAVAGGRHRPTLVLDLDETLVHSALQPPRGFHADGSPISSTCVYVPVGGSGAAVSGAAVGTGGGRGVAVVAAPPPPPTTMKVYVRVRPGAQAFLAAMAPLYELVLFTAAQRAYADVVVDRLDPGGLFTARLCRESCVPVGDGLVKDLGVLGRDRSRMLIVDNLPSAFGWDVPNGVPITTWVGDPDDTALTDLIPYLTALVAVDDVRPIVSATFRVQERVDEAARAARGGPCGSPVTPGALADAARGTFAPSSLPATRWIAQPRPTLGSRRPAPGGAPGDGRSGGRGRDAGARGGGDPRGGSEGRVHGGSGCDALVPAIVFDGTDADAESLSPTDSDDDGADGDVDDPPGSARSEADADAMDGVMNMDGLPASPGDLGRMPPLPRRGGRRSSTVGGVPRPLSAPAPAVSSLLPGSGGVHKRAASPLFAAACGATPSWRQRPAW